MPLQSEVRASVVDSKLAVKLILCTEVGFQRWSQCFHHHDSYENRAVAGDQCDSVHCYEQMLVRYYRIIKVLLRLNQDLLL